jgi:OmpA-OmpF porin, OOP family
MSSMKKICLPATLTALALLAAPGAFAAPGDQPVQPLPAVPAQPANNTTRTTSIPAKGMFVGDQLSEATKSRLVELILNAIGLDVQVALLVPTGPWQIDGGGHTDRDLNEARLGALRKFLVERGVEPKRIFVESRIDAKLKEPRLDVQLVGKPAND